MADKTEKAQRSLSHIQFCKASDCLRKNKGVFLDARPDHKKAAEMLSTLTGFVISRNTIPSLKEASGVDWECKRGTYIKQDKANERRTLCVCLFRLYREADRLLKELGRENGLPMPDSLQQLYDYYNQYQRGERPLNNGPVPPPIGGSEI
jgi:hypothetical protein